MNMQDLFEQPVGAAKVSEPPFSWEAQSYSGEQGMGCTTQTYDKPNFFSFKKVKRQIQENIYNMRY